MVDQTWLLVHSISQFSSPLFSGRRIPFLAHLPVYKQFQKVKGKAMCHEAILMAIPRHIGHHGSRLVAWIGAHHHQPRDDFSTTSVSIESVLQDAALLHRTNKRRPIHSSGRAQVSVWIMWRSSANFAFDRTHHSITSFKDHHPRPAERSGKGI
jgi:hypothetical protein